MPNRFHLSDTSSEDLFFDSDTVLPTFDAHIGDEQSRQPVYPEDELAFLPASTPPSPPSPRRIARTPHRTTPVFRFGSPQRRLGWTPEVIYPEDLVFPADFLLPPALPDSDPRAPADSLRPASSVPPVSVRPVYSVDHAAVTVAVAPQAHSTALPPSQRDSVSPPLMVNPDFDDGLHGTSTGHAAVDPPANTGGQPPAFPVQPWQVSEDLVQRALAAYLGQSHSMHSLKIAAPPKFSGSKSDLPLDTWLFKARQYVGDRANSTAGINVAASYLEGSAGIWWQSVVTSSNAFPYATWSAFAEALRERLCPGVSVVEDATTELVNLRQGKRDLKTYIEEFTNLRTRSGRFDEATLKLLFINGLEGAFQFEAKKARPDSLEEAIALALNYDEMLRRAGKPRTPAYYTYRPAGAARPAQPLPAAAPRDGVVPMEVDALRARGPLTEEERDELRRTGGCFRCRMPGHTQHTCPLPGNAHRQ